MLLTGLVLLVLGLAALVRQTSRRHRVRWWSRELAGLSRAWRHAESEPRHRLFTGADTPRDFSQGGMLPC